MIGSMATNDEAAETEQQPLTERHASWIELFFDLMVVAGAGRLAHLLHEDPSLADVGLLHRLRHHRGRPGQGAQHAVAMSGLAVMVAAVPGVHEDEHVAALYAPGPPGSSGPPGTALPPGHGETRRKRLRRTWDG